jgi:hypothetical protein
MDTTYSVLRVRGVFVPKNRVLHARITDDTHEKLTRVCSELDCSVTDYVTSVLEESFDQEHIEEPKLVSKGRVVGIIDESKPTIGFISELQNVRIVD